MKTNFLLIAAAVVLTVLPDPWTGTTLFCAEPQTTPGAGKRPPLIAAVERGQRLEVERLLDAGTDLEVRAPESVTPLYAAAFHGRVEILRLLIDAGAKVDGRAALGRTPLFTAAAEGQIRAVEVLLKFEADPNARSDSNELAQTPLHMAAIEGQLETARRLLDHGANVNSWSDQHRITPLYLATIAGHRPTTALLRERGADPLIADIFGQTPARAATVMAERKERRLLSVNDGQLGFDTRAIVVLAYVGFSQDRRTYRGNRLAVAIGDGSVIATAAHCLEDFVEANRHSILARPLVFSPYFGDVFEAEIVGLDSVSDVALLRMPWNGHPALPLADDEDLSENSEMLVAGYPPAETQEGAKRASREVRAERLPILKIDDLVGNHQVILGGARFIGPGWSGAAMVLPDSGRLGGIFGKKNDLQVGDLAVFQNRMGGSARAIRELMSARGIRMKEPSARWKAIENSAEAFSSALGWLDAQAGRPPAEGMRMAESLVERRPQSGLARLLLATSTADLRGAPTAGNLAEKHYGDAVRLAPGSFLVRAISGAYLDRRKRPEDALTELGEADRIQPGNSFVQAARLKILSDLRPEQAEELGRRLVREIPENADYWFHYAGALRKLGREEDALSAAQTAVRLAPKKKFWYRGRLADLWARRGNFEEADACYRELLKQGPDTAVFWLWYARFLAEKQPDRKGDLGRALNRCEALNSPPTLPQEVLDELRAKAAGSEK